MIHYIISGGQTGVDRAALDVALKHGIPHGGWCPAGRRADDGRLHERYQLRETQSPNYSERTKLNVDMADGTLILFMDQWRTRDGYLPKGGTRLTADYAQGWKPLLIVDPQNETNVERVLDWMRRAKIRKLNVAGPRQKRQPIYEHAFRFLEKLL